MKNLLWILVILLLVIWYISFFILNIEKKTIHLFAVIACLIAIYNLFNYYLFKK
ncbi:DUF5670 family protein [Myroides injenensis]|uniref:DUF5670 family protein n=1 Tax=Myroides injenensis TaxID=1183151 RepID=UPI0034E22065